MYITYLLRLHLREIGEINSGIANGRDALDATYDVHVAFQRSYGQKEYRENDEEHFVA
jgi:hypothetical protein